jgi:hypothetical protein
MSRIVLVILIYYHQKPIDSINSLGSQRRRNVFPVRYGQTCRVELDRTIGMPPMQPSQLFLFLNAQILDLKPT